MIVDTDILIWYFRGNEKAKALIEKLGSFSISAVTVMELMQGAQNKTEQQAIIKQIHAWNVKVIHLNETISIRATQFVSDFALSHSMSAMDALIAGTTIENGGELHTANTKHFEYIPGVKVNRFLSS